MVFSRNILWILLSKLDLACLHYMLVLAGNEEALEFALGSHDKRNCLLWPAPTRLALLPVRVGYLQSQFPGLELRFLVKCVFYE